LNLFVSDIAIGDDKSSFQMIKPLLNKIQAQYGGVTVLSPKILNDQKNFVSHEYFMPFYKSRLLFLRLLSELTLSLVPYVSYLLKVKNKRQIENVILYSPSIFLIFFVILQKFFSKKERRYFLILRDLFPIWAYDTGVIKNKAVYNFFWFVSSLQFKNFDVVGVQDEKAIKIIRKNYKVTSKIFVLPNWLANPLPLPDVNILKKEMKQLILNEEKYVIYTGNFGEAQGLVPLVKGFRKYIMNNFSINTKLLIVGEGKDFSELKTISEKSSGRILISEPIPEGACDLLIKNSVGGIVSLNRKHETNNIPGKFLKYLSLGIPVIANINSSNLNLSNQIQTNSLGIVFSADNLLEIENKWYTFFLQNFNSTEICEFFNKNCSFEYCAEPIFKWIKNEM
jgi:O26-antigen biosynthesis N-acetyl-L-fucosamine transferase